MQDADATVRTEVTGRPLPSAGVPRHVLVLDDDVDTVEMMAFLLRHSGYRVTPTSTALAAQQVLEQDVPDIVLLDVTLGGEPMGLDFARAARALEPVRVVLHTALPEEIVRAQFVHYDAFLRKPVPVATLLAVLADTPALRA